MDNSVIIGLFISGGISIGATGCALVALARMDWISKHFHSHNNLPNIIGTQWDCEWFLEDGNLDVRDRLEILKWTKNSQFKALGHQSRTIDGKIRKYTYKIKGEVAPSGAIVITYKADKYPTQGNIGVACMELSLNAETIEGLWCGRKSAHTIEGEKVIRVRGGKVKCTRINS